MCVFVMCLLVAETIQVYTYVHTVYTYMHTMTVKYSSPGLKAREELLVNHELKAEITEVEDNPFTDAELFYDIVGFVYFSSIYIQYFTNVHLMYSTYTVCMHTHVLTVNSVSIACSQPQSRFVACASCIHTLPTFCGRTGLY